MTDNPATPDAMPALADHLAARRPAILQAWRAAVDGDPNLTAAAALSRAQFFDHIPTVLDDLEGALRGPPPQGPTADATDGEEGAAAHGQHRWQQGYQLHEVTREWGHLHLGLLAELEQFARAHPEHAGQMPAAYRTLARLCHAGVSDSADSYFRLRQLEAAGQVRDLEEALSSWRRLERHQADVWRAAAHDLRGRLGVVRNVSFLLNQSNVATPVRDQFLGMLDRSVSALHALLEDVAGLARLQAGYEHRQLAPMDAGALLRDLCEVHQPLARERGLSLTAEGPESLPVEGDAVKIDRIVQNLLLNALKYTEQGGVTVRWGDSRRDDPGRWMLCVQDTGPGLHTGADAPLAAALKEATQEAREVQGAPTAPPDDPASSTPLPSAPRRDARPSGEGIGLSIVKHLCELLEASLELESAPGVGTTFRVLLPRRYQPAPGR